MTLRRGESEVEVEVEVEAAIPDPDSMTKMTKMTRWKLPASIAGDGVPTRGCRLSFDLRTVVGLTSLLLR